LDSAAKGYRVFGTAFSPDEISDLAKASTGRSALGVRHHGRSGSRAWAGEVTGQNDGSIDLVINNAGILTPGPLEILPINAIRREFE